MRRPVTVLALALALAFVGFAGCVTYQPGLAVPVRITPSAGGALTVAQLGDGTELVLDDVVVTVESVELVACGAPGGHVHHALLELLGPPRARAQHHHASPLVASGPFVVHFADEAVEMPALLEPAPGCYDRVVATLSSLALGARAGDRYLSARSAGGYVARAILSPALELAEGDQPSLEVTLAEPAPFALLPGLPEDGALDGDAILAGLAAQASARITQ